jgi:hypothetical protein
MFLNKTTVHSSQQKYIIFKSVFLWLLQIRGIFVIIQLEPNFFISDEVKHKNNFKTHMYT